MKIKKHNIYILLFLIFCSADVFAQRKTITKTVEEFIAEADAAGMTFTMPAGYHAIPLKVDYEFTYDFAIKNDTADFEIRYNIFPLQDEVAKFKKCMVDSSCKMKNPNATYRSKLEERILKISCGIPQLIAVFPRDAMRKEMNCDDGGFVFYKPDSDFGEDYKVVQTVVFHKNDVADVMINYLSKDRQLHEELMMAPFGALIYKP